MRRIAFILACALLLALAGTAQARPLYITLTFDDGLYSQWTQRDLLDAYGFKGTFFVNSGNVRPPYNMSYADLNELEDEGHEVGGHTINHVNLTTRTTPDQITQVCDDRRALLDNGIDARNFAYPHGAWNAGVKTVVRDCGYETARTTGGLDYPDPCCVFAETTPPGDAYTLRAAQPTGAVELWEYRAVIEQARDEGGGWLMFVLHDICTGTCAGWNSYAIRRELLEDLFDWIVADPRIRVRTTAHMMAVSRDRTAPTVTLTAPADDATVAAGPVTLSATASDGVGLERVDFLVDGNVVASDVTAPYSATWDSTNFAPDATIVARAYDEQGNWADSAAHDVTITGGLDRTPPTVALTSPADRAIVTGTVPIAATASDASGVSRVEFLVDGVVVGRDDDAPFAHSWDSSGTTGSATLSAKAYDPAGNHATSATRTVTVDRTAPTVSLSSIPSTVSGFVGLHATASDGNGIARVEFLVNGTVVATDTTNPYEASWDSAPQVGTVPSVTARAYDAAGNQTTSAARRPSVVANRSTVRPTVTLQTPPGGTTVRGAVDLIADVSSTTNIAYVEFLVDGTSIGIDWSASFHEWWDTSLASGPTATVVARVVDQYGTAVESAPMVLTIG